VVHSGQVSLAPPPTLGDARARLGSHAIERSSSHPDEFMRLTRSLAPLLALAMGPAFAFAQPGVEFTSFPPSIRAAAMAGAGNAIFWGGSTDDWANPALIAFHEGMQYEFGTVALVPQVFTDAHFTTNRFTLGGAGLGVLMAGSPFGIGRQRFDLGTLGFLGGTTHLGDDIASWGVGVSLSGLVRLSHGMRGTRPPGFTRHFDVAAGYNHKVDSPWVGSEILRDFETRAHDIGVLARVTPLNTFGSDAAHPKRIDVSYGWSVIDQNDVDGGSGHAPLARVDRNGVAARFLLDRAPDIAPYQPRGPWAGNFSPWISVSFAFDFDHRQTPSVFFSPGAAVSTSDVQRMGLELIMANVVALRVGHVEVEGNDTTTLSYGGGIGYSFGQLGRVSYDFASTPVMEFPRMDHHGISVRLDPLALARTIH
jgi:hypothetical protein